MSLRFYTYIHRRASDMLVFYVGKGVAKRAYTTKGRNSHWDRTFKKHGIIVEIVAYWFTEDAAHEHEKVLIAEYRSAGMPLCNKTDGGEGVVGLKHSDESRAKMSANQKGKKLSEACKAKLQVYADAAKGKKRNPAIGAKIASALTGRKCSLEHNRKNAEARKGKPLPPAARVALIAKLTGVPRSEEVRKKISIGHIGKVISEAHRLKISIGNSGKVRTKEFCENMSKSRMGHGCSDETRAKIGAKHKGKVITVEQRAKISNKLKELAKDPARIAQLSANAKAAYARRKAAEGMTS